jgi:23S rRNA pseudouridine1911/1915/1917 synthase
VSREAGDVFRPSEVYRVDECESRMRLDRFVEKHLPDVSRGRIRRAILRGEVTLNGAIRESGRLVSTGDVVEFRAQAPVVSSMAEEKLVIPILYEDDALLVVDKPSGMLAHPTSRVHSGTVINAVAWHVNRTGGSEPRVRPLLVHRLDQATSGALVVSKTLRAHNALARAFGERRVTKTYLALVCGSLPSEKGIIDAPIGGSRDRVPGFAVDENGRPARTAYRRLAAIDPYTLVELRPLTGRTNQLRIHCDHAGAPIAGDDLHGLARIAEFRSRTEGEPYPSRLFLHAAAIEFPHPDSLETIRVTAPLADELEGFLAALRQRAGPGCADHPHSPV